MRFLLTLLPILFLSSCQTTTTLTGDNSYQLVWSDEFQKPGLPDSTKWDYDIGGHGWGNNELQFYTEKHLKNARVEKGKLIIEAVKEAIWGLDYSSARLVSKGKGEWLYGKIEIKAKLPKGKGTWPAIWMLPVESKYGPWPESGEIDIMEHVGFDNGNIHGTVHTEAYNHMKNTHKSGTIFISNISKKFHVYSIKWAPDEIVFMVNNKPYYSFFKKGNEYSVWPFDQPFYLILNIAVGGYWGGQKGIGDNIWPQKMEIDYVRVYQKIK